MEDPLSVITTAVDGIGTKLAEEFEVSHARLYQILEADAYGKTKRLIRKIGRIDATRLAIIKADLDALFASFEPDVFAPTASEVHSELFDVIQSHLERRSNAEQLREIREAIAVLNAHMTSLERKTAISQKVTAQFGGLQ